MQMNRNRCQAWGGVWHLGEQPGWRPAVLGRQELRERARLVEAERVAQRLSDGREGPAVGEKEGDTQRSRRWAEAARDQASGRGG